MSKTNYNNSVFINCPFDKTYLPVFQAIVFTIFDCGFIPRCALEISDGTQTRIEKLGNIIGNCRLGIHDISCTSLDNKYKLPRFNMPLELGMFLGAKIYGEKINKRKACIIFDKDRYRYQKFISDIAGQDVFSHNNRNIEATITIVRDWLSCMNRGVMKPSGKRMYKRYLIFFSDFTKNICKEMEVSKRTITFNDYCWVVSNWLKEVPYT